MDAINHQAKMNEYRQFVERFVNKGRLLTIFIEHMKMIRQITRNSKNKLEERNYLISYIVNMLKEICEDTLRCHSCKKPYHFRHCKNPKSTRWNNVYHAIEISFADCGDYYTFKENKKRVIYFNIYVQEQVSRLKRSAKGLMMVTDRSLSHPL